jgi:hypothetical protein
MGKRGKRLERAVAIRDVALKLVKEHGHWEKLGRGPEVKLFEDERFLILFYIQPPVPLELQLRFGVGPLHSGLYSLELCLRPIGKVLNLAWDSAGAPPQIVSFRRGEWEDELLLYAFATSSAENSGEAIVSPSAIGGLDRRGVVCRLSQSGRRRLRGGGENENP